MEKVTEEGSLAPELWPMQLPDEEVFALHIKLIRIASERRGVRIGAFGSGHRPQRPSNASIATIRFAFCFTRCGPAVRHYSSSERWTSFDSLHLPSIGLAQP